MMNEPEKPDEPSHELSEGLRDESLANVPPTPMEPERVTRVGNLALGAVVLTAAGAGAFLLIAGTMTPCMGATRSTRLEWEKRQQEIEQAEREAEAGFQANNTRSETDASPSDFGSD